MATVDQAAAELQLLLRGSYLEASAPEYDEARKLYDAMIDKRRPRSCAAPTSPT